MDDTERLLEAGIAGKLGAMPPGGMPGQADQSPPDDTETMLQLGMQGKLRLPPTPPPAHGLAANFAAGANQSIFGAVGAPVDLATGAMNLGVRGINAATGAGIPQIQTPVGGSDWMKQQFGRVSVNPDTVQPANEDERMAQGAGAAVAQVPLMALGGGVASGAKGLVGGVGRALSESGGTTAGSAALTGAAAAAGGAVGQGAEDVAPDGLKPYAGLAGNLAGAGGVVGAAKAGAYVGGQVIARKAGEFGIGPKGELGGVRSTASQQNAAGQTVSDALGDQGRQTFYKSMDAENEARGLEAQLANPATTTTERQAAAARLDEIQGNRVNIVPNENPTTAQLAQTAGASSLERAHRVADGTPWVEQGNAANNARVAEFNAVQPTGNPASVGQAFTEHLNNIDRLGQTDVAGARQAVAGATDTLGGQQTTADLGGQVRGVLQEAKAPVHIATRRAWSQVDPEGTWALEPIGLKQAATDLGSRITSTSPLVEKEAALIDRASSLPDVIPFSTLSDLRADTNAAMRKAVGKDGNDQSMRRLSLLKQAIDKSISNAIDQKAAKDPAVAARVQQEIDRSGIAGSATDSGAVGEQPNPDMGARGGGVQVGAGVPGQGRSGMPGSNPGVAPVEAAGGNQGNRSGVGEPLKGSNRAPETLHDFVISKGGVQDQSGDYTAQDLDRIHHRAGGRLINPNGLSEDYMREAAVQEGFLPQHADVNDFRDAMTSQAPVYRASETADAMARRQAGTQSYQQQQAHDTARDEVAVAAEQSGRRFTPAEIDHAADLRMQGLHPDEAIRQAAEATEGRVLDRNAAANAIGSPGVPLAARQTEMPVSSGPQLQPNLTAENAGQYMSAVNATRAEKERFGQGGVGQVLRPGNTDGAFIPEGNVPGKIFTAGPTEPREVERFIAAVGGVDKAADLGRNVLANDLRHKGIIKPDGQVDPDRLAKWQEDRKATIAQFPGLGQHFKSAEAAQRTLDNVTAAHVQAVRDFEKSAAGNFIRDDPFKAVQKAFASGNPTATFTELARLVRGKPDAEAGLKRAVLDYVNQRFVSGPPTGAETEMIRSKAFRDFISDQTGPLRALFGGQGINRINQVGMDNIKRVEMSLRRAAEQPAAVSGSQTASHGANAARTGVGAAKHGSQWTTALTLLGEHLGHAASGSIIGQGIGAVALPYLGSMGSALKQAGIKTRNDLVREMMLHPELAKVGMEKAQAGKALSGAVQRRIGVALQGAIMADIAGHHDR